VKKKIALEMIIQLKRNVADRLPANLSTLRPFPPAR